MWEPVVDARRLLGARGLTGGGSPYLSMALRKLDKTFDWNETRDELHAIHRIAHNDVTVIPLWQIYPTMAYRKTLSGVKPRPLLLYDNVEEWKIDLDIPGE
jgi:ABC-type transport system substrate-binding protein